MYRVGFVQSAPKMGDAEENRVALADQARRLEADLIVMPELCHSGYLFTSREETASLAEPIPTGPTSQMLMALAAERECTIVAGICERNGDRLYNSAATFSPAGHLDTYRKIHLFQDENRWFEPGDTPFHVFDVDGVRLGVLVCYDWRFPEAARCLALLGADLIAHPANLVLPYCQEVMRARCIENRIFAVTANRVGTDARPDGRTATFTGRSQVISPEGEILVRATDEQVEEAVIAIDHLQARKKTFGNFNHVLTDRRPEFYGPLVDPTLVRRSPDPAE